MLREEGMPADGLGLGVGHWRPSEHVVEAGRQLVLAAVEAGRPSDARRILDVRSPRTPTRETVAAVRVRAASGPSRRPSGTAAAAGPGSGQIPVVDVRERKLFKRDT